MSSSTTEPTTGIEVAMPQMGVSATEGTLVEWRKQPGDWVEADEVICCISTDKIDTEVESPASGRVSELLVNEGETVDVGVVLARIVPETGESGPPQDTSPPPAPEAISPSTPQAPASSTTDSQFPQGNRRRYSPVATRIAIENNIDLDQIEGSGRNGRVRKQDVLAAMESRATSKPTSSAPNTTSATTAPAELGPFHRAPLSRIRQSIGRHMHESLQVAATCTTIVECDMGQVELARQRDGMTYLPYVARATIDTLRDFPSLNATLEDETFTQYEPVHLGVAVSLGEAGLIVPVIHHASDLSVEGLGKRIKDIAQRARSNRLNPDEVRNGTFTITNPGAFGAILATPVINQPQVAILDSEAVVKRPVVVTDDRGREAIAIRPMTYFCMSWDHRAVDGALAAQFLASLRTRLEKWPT